MAQALIQPGTPPIVVMLVDPVRVQKSRDRYHRDEIPELEHANTFCAPAERWPARGWVLVKRADYNRLSLFATNLQLQIDELTGPQSAITFQNLAIVQARCVTRGIAADPESVYLVELTDARGVLENNWSTWPLAAQYNIRAPAYPQQFYANSTNSGTPWTWSGMIGDIWGRLPLLGPYPGLPTTPTGTPEGFSFPGTSGMAALESVLNLLGMQVSYNPLLANPYGIASAESTDAVLSALVKSYFPKRIQDDHEYLDFGSGRAPGQVNVFFHQRYQYYGTEETVRLDSLQWQTLPPYFVVSVPGPAPYSASPGVAILWCEFTVRLDINGVPLTADVLTAQAIAAERTAQYYTRITRGQTGYLKNVFAGALPFYAGTLFDGVAWRQDGRFREGWTTTVIRGPVPPFKQLDRSEA